MSEEDANETSAPQWGCPWHGVIRRALDESGNPTSQQTLTLADGTEMPWVSSNAASLYYGDTIMQRAPWALQNPETPASMAAEGMEWRDYALMGGWPKRMHDKVLEGWIYCCHDSGFAAPYLIRMRENDVLGGNQAETTLRFDVYPSGKIGTDWWPVTRSVTVTVDQTTPGIPNPSIYSRVLQDVTPDGHKAIIGMFVDWEPVGFLLVEVSGRPDISGFDFDISVTELAGRTACMGSITSVPMPVEQYENIPTPVWEEGPRDPGAGTYVWYGHLEYTQFNYVSRDNGTAESTIENKIIGYLFDDQGVPEPVRMTHTQTHSASVSQHDAELIVGEQTIVSPNSQFYPGQSFWGDMSASLTLVSESAINITMTLTYKGVTLTETITGTATRTATRTRNSSGLSETLAGTLLVETPAGTQSSSSWNDASLGIPSFEGQFWSPLGLYPLSPLSSPPRFRFRPLRYSNRAFAITGRFDLDLSQRWTSAVLTPDGIKGAAGLHPRENIYGSYQPVTGEGIFAQRTPVRYT